MTPNTNNRILAFFQDTMESEAWKYAVSEAYKQWKYNKVHKDIKDHFTAIQKREDKFGQSFKKESGPLVANLSQLKEDVEKAKSEDKVSKIRDGSSVEFFGQQIDVGDADDEEVDNFYKETVFGGFLKTIKKLCEPIYLAIKSMGDVLKKLMKKLYDYMECGMMK